jgi:hypothetical protein
LVEVEKYLGVLPTINVFDPPLVEDSLHWRNETD